MSAKVAAAALLTALIATPAAADSWFPDDPGAFKAAGFTMPRLGPYATYGHTVAYPDGFTVGNLTITGADLTGTGPGLKGPPALSAEGTMTFTFAVPVRSFAFWLEGPGYWDITVPPEGTAKGGGPEPAQFLGIGFDSLLSSMTITNEDGPTAILTMPPVIEPEPAGLWALLVGLVALSGLRCARITPRREGRRRPAWGPSQARSGHRPNLTLRRFG